MLGVGRLGLHMRVFVSSTFLDLKHHREKVIRVLNGLNLSPAAMEYFGSRADEPSELCLEEIEACDLFIGIYAWRYGFQPGGRRAVDYGTGVLEGLRAEETNLVLPGRRLLPSG